MGGEDKQAPERGERRMHSLPSFAPFGGLLCWFSYSPSSRPGLYSSAPVRGLWHPGLCFSALRWIGIKKAFSLDPFDRGAYTAQLFLNAFVAAIEVIDTIDQRLS